MSDSSLHQEAMSIEGEAWKIIKAFDDAAESIGADRRIQYAAFIMMMTAFCRASPTPVEDILTDFCERVGAGTLSQKAPTQ